MTITHQLVWVLGGVEKSHEFRAEFPRETIVARFWDLTKNPKVEEVRLNVLADGKFAVNDGVWRKNG